MEPDVYWEEFEKTGSVDSFLKYKKGLVMDNIEQLDMRNYTESAENTITGNNKGEIL